MIRVKQGVSHPDMKEVDISYWTGDYGGSIEKDDQTLVLIHLDQETKSRFSKGYLEFCKKNELNSSWIYLDKNKLKYN